MLTYMDVVDSPSAVADFDFPMPIASSCENRTVTRECNVLKVVGGC